MTDQTTTQDGTNKPPVDDSPLNSLVGDGKKFRDVDDLAKAKLESDKFITKVQDENRELRRLLAVTDAKVEDLTKRADFTQRLSSTDETSRENGNPPEAKATAATSAEPGLKEDDVFRLVESYNVKQNEQNNLQAVNAMLVKEFGAEAKDAVARRAAELQLPLDYFMNTAKKSPQAFYSLLGLNTNSSRNQSLTSRASGVNTSAMKQGASQTTGVRNRAFYEAEKKKVGATKFALNTDLQVQMHKDMNELGDLFD